MRIYYSIDQKGARAYFLGNFDSYTDATKVARQLINERQQSSICAFHSGESFILSRQVLKSWNQDAIGPTVGPKRSAE